MSMRNDHDPYDLKVQADSRTEVIGTTSNHLFWGHHPPLGQRGRPPVRHPRGPCSRGPLLRK